jgi:hypothetical protein
VRRLPGRENEYINKINNKHLERKKRKQRKKKGEGSWGRGRVKK